MSDLCRQITRRAAKEHRCEECGETIPKGTEYWYFSGVFDGSGFSHKMCKRCESVAHIACQFARYDEDDTPRLGCLAEWCQDVFGDDLKPASNRYADIIAAAYPVLVDLVDQGKRLLF